MKNIIAIVLFFFSFCLIPLIAQKMDYKLTKSKLLKVKEKGFVLVYSATTEKGEVLTVSKYRTPNLKGRSLSGYQLNHYDAELNLLTTKTLPDKQISVIGLDIRGNKINLLSIIKNKQGGIDYTLLYSDLNKELDFKKRKLFSIEKKDLLTTLGRFEMGTHLNCCDNEEDSKKLIFSENNKYMAFIGDLNGSKVEARRIYVLDEQLNTVIDYTFRSSIKDKSFVFQNFNLDNKGNVYFLGKVDREKKKNKPDYHYELYKVTKDGHTKAILNTEDLFVASLTSVTKKGRLSYVGFYSKDSDYVFDGVVRFDVNMDNLEITKPAASPFTEKFFNDKYGKKKRAKYLRSFTMKSAFMLDDGDIIVNGEEFESGLTPTSNGRSSSRTDFDDIIIVRMNIKGTIVWARLINKSQRSSTAGKYFSYTSTVVNEKNIFFLNGSDEVKKLKDGRIEFLEPSSLKKANLYVVIVDQEGKIDYKKLITSEKEEICYEVSHGVITDKHAGNEILLLGSNKTKKQLLKINLE